MFNHKQHDVDIYSKLLFLSRNILFYKEISFKDTFETRVFLMFIHYSIVLLIFKKKNQRIDQDNYNSLFHSIENNLRELGLGDISVNKKMKDLNKFFYDILLKLNISKLEFKLNKELMIKYFEILGKNHKKWKKFELYFEKFYKFCFELSPENMIEDIDKYRI